MKKLALGNNLKIKIFECYFVILKFLRLIQRHETFLTDLVRIMSTVNFLPSFLRLLSYLN